jgi:hypothetical protein
MDSKKWTNRTDTLLAYMGENEGEIGQMQCASIRELVTEGNEVESDEERQKHWTGITTIASVFIEGGIRAIGASTHSWEWMNGEEETIRDVGRYIFDTIPDFCFTHGRSKNCRFTDRDAAGDSFLKGVLARMAGLEEKKVWDGSKEGLSAL